MSHRQEATIHGMSENASIPFILGAGEAIGIGVTVDHVGYIGDNSPANFRAMQYGYDIAYGREIIPTLSIGAGIGVRYGRSDVSSLLAVSSTTGIIYSPAPEISYGAMFTGLGNGIVYASDLKTTSLSTARLPRKLLAGLTLRFPGTLQRTIFTISAANEKIFGEDGIRYMGGIELYPVRFLTLRTGYLYTNAFAAATFGLGIQLGGMHLDYSISPSRVTDQATSVTCAVTF